MSAEVGGVDRHHDDVTGAGGDVAVAARAQVRLHGFVRLDPSHLHRPVAVVLDPRHIDPAQPRSAQASRAMHTTNAAATST